MILLAFPPVRWTISRLDPNRAEVRQSARVRVIGRSGSDRSGIWTTLTLTNRAHHEIRNLHVLTHSTRCGPIMCADLLLPGESVTRSIGKWFPSFLEVIFEDWSGTTWVHRRSVIVWAEQYPLRPGTSGYGDNIQCRSEAAVATSKLRMSVRWLGEPLLVLVEHFRLRRGIQQLNVPVADYLERTEDMPREFSESDTEFI